MMNATYSVLKIKKLRCTFGLSESYIAKYLDMEESEYHMLENLNQISNCFKECCLADDIIQKLSVLYGVPTEYFLNGDEIKVNNLPDVFNGLCEEDKREIVRLMQYKEGYKRNRCMTEPES